MQHSVTYLFIFITNHKYIIENKIEDLIGLKIKIKLKVTNFIS